MGLACSMQAGVGMLLALTLGGCLVSMLHLQEEVNMMAQAEEELVVLQIWAEGLASQLAVLVAARPY